MLNKIVEPIKKIFTTQAYDYFALVCIALPTLVFVAIALFGGGQSAKIRRGFKRVLKQAKYEALTVAACCGLVHKTVADKIRLAGMIGELPGACATQPACVTVPAAFSPKRNCGSITLGTMAIAATLSLTLGLAVGSEYTYWVVLFVVAAGGVFSLAGLIVSRLYVKRLTAAYEAAMAIINEAYVAEKKASAPVYGEAELDEPSSNEYEAEAENMDYNEYAYVDDYAFAEATESDNSEETLSVIEEDRVKTVYAEDEYDDFIEEYVQDEIEPSEPEKENVVERVEHIAQYGATIEEMKEVAALLKLERTKPENRTPARKKILDEAFASLLRSVSNVRK